MKFLSLLTSMGLSLTAFCQSSGLTVESDHPFNLSIDGNEVNLMPVTRVTIPDVKPGSVLLEFRTDSVDMLVEKKVVLKSGIQSSFELVFTDEGYVLHPGAEVVLTRPAEPGAPVINRSEVSGMPELMEKISALPFEKQKVNAMLEYLGKHEVSSAELEKMLAGLDVEDNKLMVLEKAVHAVSDCENLHQVLPRFYLEKSKSRAHEIIQRFTEKN